MCNFYYCRSVLHPALTGCASNDCNVSWHRVQTSVYNCVAFIIIMIIIKLCKSVFGYVSVDISAEGFTDGGIPSNSLTLSTPIKARWLCVALVIIMPCNAPRSFISGGYTAVSCSLHLCNHRRWLFALSAAHFMRRSLPNRVPHIFNHNKPRRIITSS